jgi:hypothetical protein
MRGNVAARLAALVALTAAMLATSVAVDAAAPTDAPRPGLADPSLLEFHDGGMTVTEDGTVIENMEIHGRVEVHAKDVVMRNVWVYANDFWTILVREGGELLIEDSEIGHPEYLNERGIGVDNVVARNVYIHDVEDGIKLGSNSLYENVVVEHLDSPSPDPHADALQADGGASNSIVRDSVLDSTGPLGSGNAAVFLKSDLGPISNITITDSFFNGGSYTVYVRDGGYGMPTDVTIADNRIGSSHVFGLLSTDGPIDWSNNVWAANGQPATEGSSPPPSVTTTSTLPRTTTTSTTEAPTSLATTDGSTTPSTVAIETTVAAAETTTGADEGRGWWGSVLEDPQRPVFVGLAAALLLMLVLILLVARNAWAVRRRSHDYDRG